MSDKPDIVQIKMDQPNLPRPAAVGKHLITDRLSLSIAKRYHDLIIRMVRYLYGRRSTRDCSYQVG
uniref:hypothetical protein n=1 Tax=Lacticaseibacillus jixiensis TaxID=3231926 RepID=UPI0036F335DB